MTGPGKNLSASPIVTVREMLPSDVPALSAILKESPEASSWPEESLLESAHSGVAWVAEAEGCAIGFLIGRGVLDEFEILNLAVAQCYRRRGIATRLLGTMAAWTKESGTRRAFLEVRASNAAAMALYVQNSFSPCGRRVRYYQYPVEDAVVLTRDMEMEGTS